MNSFKEIKVNELTYWVRITGNRYGWNIFVQIPSTPQCPMQPYVKYPFWERPKDKIMREAFYEDIVREAIKIL